MGCTCCHDHKHEPQRHAGHEHNRIRGTEQNENRAVLLRMSASALLLAAGFCLRAADAAFFQPGAVQLAWFLAAYLPVGIPVLREAAEGLRQKEYFSEFTLMVIATLGAFYIGEYPEGVAVMLFYSIGEYFQDRAVDKAKRNIQALLDIRPETVTVLRDKAECASPCDVRTGELIEIKAGGRIPLDGTLQTESASFDTAALTGESVPRTIRRGEEVLAGMIVTDKVIRLQVTRPYNQSALARILEMVQNATARKAPAELFIRKFARIYTPAVTGLALLIVLIPYLYSLAVPGFSYRFDDFLYRALVFLVVSCPCALVVSIPLSYFGGIGSASGKGILFKGGNYLDIITRVNTVVFDKTGTLTQGVFDIREIHTANGFHEDDLLGYAASAEQSSTHPVATAVMRHAQQRAIRLEKPELVEEIAGRGLKAMLDGREILAGNVRLLEEAGISCPEELKQIPETIVCCAVEGVYAGYLLLSDKPKDDARRCMDELKQLGITNLHILSGDKEAIVSKLAKELGIPHYHGDLLPEGKVHFLEELKNSPASCIAFVGDGINDAPVLAMSHIGVAMGGLGSDMAIETADVVIQNDQPSRLPSAIRIGRATRNIVWQNIIFALGVKIIVLFLGALGVATLWEAVFADVGVALLAILNATRMRWRS